VQNSYGGPAGLKKLVDAAHAAEMAVILDVVYNHLGPEGNYLHSFGPYFTTRYRTSRGGAINFDGACSNEVRDYFIENAISWFRDYHIDALRLDAIHGIFDMSAKPVLQELNDRVNQYEAESSRPAVLIAESDLNDSRVIRPKSQGGYGLPAQWSDDLHHALHTLLTRESAGYYADFGKIEHLVKAINDGYVYSGQYSLFRRRNHGNSSADLNSDQFVVFSQNHDQVGNRMKGDRLTGLVSFEALKLAAGTILLGPNIPMLWMGEEYAELAPFQYFVSHGDADLVEAVRKGRQEEFAAFGWQETPPDPQDEATFERSKLDWSLREKGDHRVMLQFYRRLLELRRTIPALNKLTKEGLGVVADEKVSVLFCLRQYQESIALYLMNLGDEQVSCAVQLITTELTKLLDSADAEWQGPGAVLPSVLQPGNEINLQPWNIALYSQENRT
jgi:maltooligosyltrehalose trehalohydrolase